MTASESAELTITVLFWAVLLAVAFLPLLASDLRRERAPHRRAETRCHPSAEPPPALTGEAIDGR